MLLNGTQGLHSPTFLRTIPKGVCIHGKVFYTSIGMVKAISGLFGSAFVGWLDRRRVWHMEGRKHVMIMIMVGLILYCVSRGIVLLHLHLTSLMSIAVYESL